MTKKSTNLLLGIAVLIIWGGAAYRLISGLNDNEEPLPVTASVIKPPAEDFSPVADTGQLRLNYRDPFGLETAAAKDLPAKDTVRRLNKSIHFNVKPLPEDISFIKYAGYIANPNAKRTLIMLIINGKTAMLNEGESVEGIKLLKRMQDSVKISYRGRIRFIGKSS